MAAYTDYDYKGYHVRHFSHDTESAELVWHRDRKDRYIGPKEINSGCTTFSGNPKVSIWRSEEMDKVILHEIIHSLDLEQRQDLTEIEEFIYQHFDDELTILLFLA